MSERHDESCANKRAEACTICTGSIRNRAFLETCLHSYCLKCIVGWSNNPKHQFLCPTCHRPYQTVLYDIKHDATFEIYEVPISDYTSKAKVEIPETECSICFGDFVDRASVEPCLHSFCFNCIKDWAKVRRLCPFCNGKIDCVYHKVKEDLSYEVYEFEETETNKIIPSQNQSNPVANNTFHTIQNNLQTFAQEETNVTATQQNNTQPSTSTSSYEPRESNLSFDRRTYPENVENKSETDDIDVDDYYSVNEEMNSVHISHGRVEDEDDDEVYVDAEEYEHSIDFQGKCEEPQVEQIRKGWFSRAKSNEIKDSKNMATKKLMPVKLKDQAGKKTIRAASGLVFLKKYFNFSTGVNYDL